MFYIATNGNDAWSGSLENPNADKTDGPFASVAQARDAIRAMRKEDGKLEKPIKVLIRGGFYALSEPLVFGPEDSGTKNCPITYEAYPGETSIISGGRSITGWKKMSDGLWSASIPPDMPLFSHLFVNDRRATVARTPNTDEETPFLQIQKANLRGDLKSFTLEFLPGVVKDWSHPSDIRITVPAYWFVSRKRVAEIAPGKNLVILKGPHAGFNRFSTPAAGRWCFLENAREMLDQPGEWHLDPRTRTVAYKPLPGQDMKKADVMAPILTQLLILRGTEDNVVHHLHFNGIRFAHADWTLPEGGSLALQATFFRTATDSEQVVDRPAPAILWEYAENCSLKGGSLAHAGGNGIQLRVGCSRNVMEGNEIFDISANGIMVGNRQRIHTPRNNRVSNNHVHHCGVDFYGAIGIWAGITEGTVIRHNFVHHLPYTGISVGWCWNEQPTECASNVVENNLICDVMNRVCDGGGIYTLGYQPGTILRENVIHGVHHSRFAHGAGNNGIFFDEGSSGYLVERNVVYDTADGAIRFNQTSEEKMTFRDNVFANAEAHLKTVQPKGKSAGLTPPYDERLLDVTGAAQRGLSLLDYFETMAPSTVQRFCEQWNLGLTREELSRQLEVLRQEYEEGDLQRLAELDCCGTGIKDVDLFLTRLRQYREGGEAKPRLSYRINCGASQSECEKQGGEWQRDQPYTEGITPHGFSGPGLDARRGDIPISNTKIASIYRTERYDLDGYHFLVPNGQYTVRLHFAETWAEEAGSRILDVEIEGTSVLENLDIVKEAGFRTALVKTIKGVKVTDGKLDIRFSARSGSTAINAIEVIREGES